MTGQEAAINGWTLTDLRTRAESSAVAECLPNRSCLEPEVHELAEFVIALLDDRAALVDARAERDQAVAERDRYRDALESIEQNASGWHGPEPEDSGHVRALAVITAWCVEALAVSTP